MTGPRVPAQPFERGEPWQIRFPACALLDAVAARDHGARLVLDRRRIEKGLDERRLADSGLADDKDELAPFALRRAKGRFEAGHLTLTLDQRKAIDDSRRFVREACDEAKTAPRHGLDELGRPGIVFE